MRPSLFIAVRRSSTPLAHRSSGSQAESSLPAVAAFSVAGLLIGCLVAAVPADGLALTLGKVLFIAGVPAIAALAGRVLESRE
jgi:hypothetical protein